jgi:hypothetical protein
LFVAGRNVAVNGHTVANGISIHSGDTVTTGSASGALVRLHDSSVQMDQNTSVVFFGHVRNYLGCTGITDFTIGQIFVAGKNLCMSVGEVLVAAESEYNWKYIPEGGVLTVVEGRVTISSTDQTSIVTAQTQASMIRGRIADTSQISAAELSETIGWRKQYRFTSSAGRP